MGSSQGRNWPFSGFAAFVGFSKYPEKRGMSRRLDACQKATPWNAVGSSAPLGSETGTTAIQTNRQRQHRKSGS